MILLFCIDSCNNCILQNLIYANSYIYNISTYHIYTNNFTNNNNLKNINFFNNNILILMNKMNNAQLIQEIKNQYSKIIYIDYKCNNSIHQFIKIENPNQLHISLNLMFFHKRSLKNDHHLEIISKMTNFDIKDIQTLNENHIKKNQKQIISYLNQNNIEKIYQLIDEIYDILIIYYDINIDKLFLNNNKLCNLKYKFIFSRFK